MVEQVANRHRRQLRGDEFECKRKAATLAQQLRKVRRQPIVDVQLAAAVVHAVDQQAHLRAGQQGLRVVRGGQRRAARR